MHPRCPARNYGSAAGPIQLRLDDGTHGALKRGKVVAAATPVVFGVDDGGEPPILPRSGWGRRELRCAPFRALKISYHFSEIFP